MQNNAEKFCFTLVTLTSEQCSGWYARKDGGSDAIILRYGKDEYELQPTGLRLDVQAAGFENPKCGFSYVFEDPLPPGEILQFVSASGEELITAKTPDVPEKIDSINEYLIEAVEPFVDFAMQDAVAAAELPIVHKEYSKRLSKLFRNSNHDQILENLICTLADMKTTLHLLSAAYLEQMRYKDPDFIKRITGKIKHKPANYVVDMAGKITGANWLDADTEGRWTGPLPRSSVMLPALAEGDYSITLMIAEEIFPGASDNIRLMVDGLETVLKRDVSTKGIRLSGKAVITESAKGFIVLEMLFVGEMLSAHDINPTISKDMRKLSYKLEKISLARIV